MESSRDPYPFPKLENDLTFASRQEVRADLLLDVLLCAESIIDCRPTGRLDNFSDLGEDCGLGLEVNRILLMRHT